MALLIDYVTHASEHSRVIQQFFGDYAGALDSLAQRTATGFNNEHKLLFCGNGGSACDAMHIAGEFVGRFKAERRGLPALALSADSGILTAIGNDYGFERIFARQVEALGRKGDVLIAMSTSGSSPNVLAAIEAAKEQGVHTVLFTGSKGKDKAALVDECFIIDSINTAHIQECTMVALHLLAEAVETVITEA